MEINKYLNIENRGGVHFDAVIFLEQLGQLELVLLLHFYDTTLEYWVRGPLFQLSQLLEMHRPFVADFLRTQEFNVKSEIARRHLSIRTSSIRSDKFGLHRSSHLLGVMPLVLFWNFSGACS